MKKKILTVLLSVLCLALLLSACGKEPPVTEQKTEEPETTTEDLWPDLDPEDLYNEELEGDWVHSDEEITLSFDGEDRFWLSDSEDGLEGRYQFDGLSLYLRDRDGNVLTGFMDQSGNLTLDALQGSFSPAQAEPELDQSLVGTWTYNYADIVFTFGTEGEFSCASPWDSFEGSYTFDGTDLEICKDGSTHATGCLEEDHRLYLDDLNGWFYTEGGISYVPLSQENELKLRPYCEPEVTRHTFADTVAFFNEDKGIYERITADWTVAQGENVDLGDGRKQIPFVGSCFIPYANVPEIEGPVAYGTTYYIYDIYTGLILSPRDFYKNEDGLYEFQFDSRDGRVELAFALDKEMAGPTGDCMDVLSFIATAYMPEWYDGLAVAAMPQPETYEEYSENIELPDIPLGMNVIGSSIESALRFSIS